MTKYEQAINEMQENVSVLKEEEKFAKEMYEELLNISKQIEEATPDDIPIDEYNNLVKRHNDLAEEYNQQVDTLDKLVSEIKENYKGVL